MVATVVVAELSYRFIETPVRRRALGRAWRRLQRTAAVGHGRRALVAVGAAALDHVRRRRRRQPGHGRSSSRTPSPRASEQGAAFAGDPFATTTTGRRGDDDRRRRPSTTDHAPRPPTTTTADDRGRRPRSPAHRADRRRRRHRPTAPTAVAHDRGATGDRRSTANVNPCLADADPALRHRRLGDARRRRPAERRPGSASTPCSPERSSTGSTTGRSSSTPRARLGPVVVVALGTNGPIGDGQLDGDDERARRRARSS